MAWIYKIKSPDKKIYIGATTNIIKRWEAYRFLNCKTQPRLYESFIKWGVEKHDFSVVTECDWIKLPEFERTYGLWYGVLGKHGLNVSIPSCSRIQSIIKKDKVGLLPLNPNNFSGDKLISINDKQLELLLLFINHFKLSLDEILLKSLEDYYEIQSHKLLKKQIKEYNYHVSLKPDGYAKRIKLRTSYRYLTI